MAKRSKSLRKIINICLGLALVIFVTASVATSVVYAQDTAPKDNICKKGQAYDPQKPCIPDPNELKSTPDKAAKTCTGGDCSGLITKYVNPAIRLMSALVGVAVVIAIVVGGVQYSSAGGDPSKVVAARKRITNAILALLAYLFMMAFLQWLLPGGIV